MRKAVYINIAISIHAAREGGDVYDRRIVCGFIRFQSTPPVKAATIWRYLIGGHIAFQSTPPVKAATHGIWLHTCTM